MGGGPVSVFPLSAVVGQDEAKTALLLNAIDPRIGGVLLRGQKGSAKTTLARALAALLGPGSPFVELPVGATEDRLVGTLDVTRALTTGERRFEPGLLADAHGGVLYVDEINLLPDHLVDVLLDVAVSGVNRVEREGVSHVHPSRFVLIGSMNPEEGELRPQLLDRFGLAATVTAPLEPADRARAVRRRLAWDADPDAAAAEWRGAEAAVAARLADCRPAAIADGLIEAVAGLCAAVGAEGLRADLTICRAAAALAGWEGRSEAGEADVRRVAPLALGHRARRDPLDPVGIDQQALADALDAVDGARSAGGGTGSDDGGTGSDDGGTGSDDGGAAGAPHDEAAPHDKPSDGAASDGAASDDLNDDVAPMDGQSQEGREGDGGQEQTRGSRRDSAGQQRPGSADGDRVAPPAVARPGAVHLDGGRTVPGPPTAGRDRRSAGGDRGAAAGGRAVPAGGRGRVIGDRRPGPGGGAPALGATARAAVERRGDSGPDPAGPLVVPGDLRVAVREQLRSRLVVLAVDASGSMGAETRMEAAKATVLGLLVDAYQRRDQVALVAFGGHGAEVILRPTGSVEVARERLVNLPTGGRTPLGPGLLRAADVITDAAGPSGPVPLLVVVTDGRATAAADGADPLEAAEAAAGEIRRRAIPAVVVDVEDGPVPLGLARRLATLMGARHLPLADLTPHRLEQVVRGGLR
jgi:magnesium chelatase subunit D